MSGEGLVCHTINQRLFPEPLDYIVKGAVDRVFFFDRTFLSLVAKLQEALNRWIRYSDGVASGRGL